MKKIKGTIVYVGGFKMPDKNAAAHRVMNNAKIFEKIGYDVVFCGVDDDILQDETELFPMGNFKTCPSKYPHSNKEWIRVLLSFKHIESVLQKCSDIKYVIAYNLHAAPLISLMRYCRKHNIKILSDVTEWYENAFSLNPKKMIMYFDTALVMRILHTKLDGIIAISSYLSDFYKRKSVKVVQIPPLVDISDKIWHQKVDDYCSFIEFVYAGNRGRNKTEKDQLGLMIESFAKLSPDANFRLTIVGISESDFREDYPEALCDLNSIENKVCFLGRLSHSESIYSLLKADYSIFFREKTRKNMAGFPTKFAEAATTGIGIIANDVSNISDYSKRCNCIFTKTMSSDEISGIIASVLETRKKTIHVLNTIFDYQNYIDTMNCFLRDI